MSQEKEREATEAIPPKSKRLSSIIWIAVLWLAARLYSELHPIGWEKLFYWKAPILFGAFPATAFLLLATAINDRTLQRFFRWAAFFFVLGSLSGLFAVGAGKAADMGFAQACVFSLVILGVLLFKFSTHKKRDGSHD